MNYYERHIGDYLKDTAHLSLLEHGVYTRLLDVYYTREGPIPEDQAARLISARSKDEREALQAVLSEFFVLIDGAWNQKRCDEELLAYREGQDGALDKKENDKERQRRARERRKELFERLRHHGIVPPWDTKTRELQTLLSRVTIADSSEPVTQPVTRDNTATQTPVPNTQYPIPNTKDKGAGIREVVPRAPEDRPTPAAEACLRMKAAGLQAVNPSHPKLVALLQAGITPDELADAAADAVAKGKPFAYALATAEGRRRDAATTPLPAKASITTPGSAGPDPTLARMDAERAAWKPPTAEVKAMLAETARRLKGATA